MRKKLTYKHVEKVINKFDPEGLLKMGAPKDEYSPEIKDIVRRRNKNNAKLLGAEIKTIFDYYFNYHSMSLKLAKQISAEIRGVKLKSAPKYCKEKVYLCTGGRNTIEYDGVCGRPLNNDGECVYCEERNK